MAETNPTPDMVVQTPPEPIANVPLGGQPPRVPLIPVETAQATEREHRVLVVDQLKRLTDFTQALSDALPPANEGVSGNARSFYAYLLGQARMMQDTLG